MARVLDSRNTQEDPGRQILECLLWGSRTVYAQLERTEALCLQEVYLLMMCFLLQWHMCFQSGDHVKMQVLSQQGGGGAWDCFSHRLQAYAAAIGNMQLGRAQSVARCGWGLGVIKSRHGIRTKSDEATVISMCRRRLRDIRRVSGVLQLVTIGAGFILLGYVPWSKATWVGKDLFHLTTLTSYSITKTS